MEQLGRSRGPADMPSEADVETFIRRFHGKQFIANPLDEKHLRSTFRKYAQMVASN